LGGLVPGAQGFCAEEVAVNLKIYELRPFTGPWTWYGIGERDKQVSGGRRRQAKIKRPFEKSLSGGKEQCRHWIV
jgi:hypothetical protein